MTKLILWITLFSFATNGIMVQPQEDKPFFYLNLGFLRSKTYAENLIFNELTMGIEVFAEAHYRFFLAKEIVSRGLLSPGLNIINLFSPQLKQKPGTHIYRLEILRKGVLFVKEVELMISWQRQQPTKKRVVFEKTEPLEYDLSMFLGNKKMAGGKKRINWRIREEKTMTVGRGPPAGRMDQRDGSYPNLGAINLLHVFSFLKNRAKQKKMEQIIKGKLLVHQAPLTFAKKITKEKKRIIKASMSIRIIKNSVEQKPTNPS